MAKGKEAREEIACIIAGTHSTFDERWSSPTADEFYDEADEIISALHKLGYRKLSQDELKNGRDAEGTTLSRKGDGLAER